MKLSKKQEVALTAVAGIGFLLVIGKILIADLYFDLKELDQKIEVAEKQLSKGLAIQKGKERISQEYKQAEPYLQFVEKNERLIFAELLKKVESVVRSVGGAIINLTPQEATEEKDGFKEYKVNFRVEVDFSQLLTFLSEIQMSTHLVRIEKLTVTAPGDGAEALMVEGTINLAVSD